MRGYSNKHRNRFHETRATRRWRVGLVSTDFTIGNKDRIVFGIDATRTDLAMEFNRQPYGRHSADLQRLLNRFRSQPVAGDYCLVVIEPHRKWALALFGATKRESVTFAGPIFSSLQDGEWHVFKLRWQACFGHALELEL